MTAISSLKPFRKSEAIALNQRRAAATWRMVFDQILYVGQETEPELQADNVKFITCEERFPHISRLVKVAAMVPGWTCIINADIIVTNHLRQVEQQLVERLAQCAMSRRWQVPENAVVDLGLDWFAATRDFWRIILPHVPGHFRIGHCLWDTWMLAAFMHFSKGACYELTNQRFIFHPKHEERENPHQLEMCDPGDGIIGKLRWPKLTLGTSSPALKN